MLSNFIKHYQLFPSNWEPVRVFYYINEDQSYLVSAMTDLVHGVWVGSGVNGWGVCGGR